MTIAYWCVLVAALIPYVLSIIAKWGPGYNHYAPRIYLDQVEGYRKRADWTQLNSYEAFPFFAAAVIIAHLTGKPQMMIDNLALAFIGFRILYVITYLANRPILRSFIWLFGYLCCIALFL